MESAVGAYAMVSKAKDALAGARLDSGRRWKDGADQACIGSAPDQVDRDGAWYVLRISVTAIAQFSGANANGN
jgi:hypothetical protein